MARKGCFDKIGLFDPALSPAEDYDRWLRIALFYRLDFVDKPLIKFRDHSATFLKDPIQTFTSVINVCNGIGRDYPEARDALGPTFNRIIAKFYTYLGERYLFMGDFKSALRNFSFSVKIAKSGFTVFRIIASLIHDSVSIYGSLVKQFLCRMIRKK